MTALGACGGSSAPQTTASTPHEPVVDELMVLLDGTVNVVDGDTYQFKQERGLVVIDSPEVGLVAVLPIGMAIGMAYVSSVNLTPEAGAWLRKGEEFGYFLFGGSDIVMLFLDRNVVLDAEVGRKYQRGERLGQLR